MIGHNQLSEPARQEVSEGLSMVVRHFIDAIKHLSELRLVAVEGSSPTARLWTIISAPPFESHFRDQIYEAYVDALSMVQQPGVTLRLINIREFEDDIDDILPPIYHVMYRRDVAA